MTPAALVAALQARGVTLRPDGERLRVRPVSRVTPAELEALRQSKAEVLVLLARMTTITSALILAPGLVDEVLGPKPDPHALAILTFDVMAAVAQLEREIQAGAIGQTPLLVRGHPLGDWLDLADVARLLRAGRRGGL